MDEEGELQIFSLSYQSWLKKYYKIVQSAVKTMYIFCNPNEKSEYYDKMTLSQEDIKKNYTKKLGQQDKRTIKGSKG